MAHKLRRGFTALLVLAGLVAVGFLLREPVTCFFFVRNLPDEVTLYVLRGSIRIMSQDGTGRCPVANAAEEQTFHAPVGSPDGQHIAFFVQDRRADNSWIERMKADGSERIRITPPELDVTNTLWFYNPLSSTLQIWSPDGDRLVFSARPSQNTDSGGALYIWSNAEGVRSVPNTDGAQAAFWSPDGEHLLFITESAHNSVKSLEIIGLDGSDRRVLAEDVTYEPARPFVEWLPDGSLVYMNRLHNESTRSNLKVVNGQTGELLAQIVFDRYMLRSFSPSPDGRQFALSAWDYRHTRTISGDGGDEVLLIIGREASSDADARVLRRDANNIPSADVVGWSSDSQHVFYQEVSGPLQQLDSVDGTEVTADIGLDSRLWQRSGQ